MSELPAAAIGLPLRCALLKTPHPSWRGRATAGQRIVGGQLLAVGEPPILMEPVVVELTLARAGQPTVYVCDHDGLRTERTVPVTDGQVRLDTGRDRALYYEIVYAE